MYLSYSLNIKWKVAVPVRSVFQYFEGHGVKGKPVFHCSNVTVFQLLMVSVDLKSLPSQCAAWLHRESLLYFLHNPCEVF